MTPLLEVTVILPVEIRLFAETSGPSTERSRLATIRPSSMLAVAWIRASRPAVIDEIAVGSNRVETIST